MNGNTKQKWRAETEGGGLYDRSAKGGGQKCADDVEQYRGEELSSCGVLANSVTVSKVNSAPSFVLEGGAVTGRSGWLCIRGSALTHTHTHTCSFSRPFGVPDRQARGCVCAMHPCWNGKCVVETLLWS